MKPRKPLPRSTKPIPRGKAPKRSTKKIVGKYQSREWRNLRARVLRRDKHWCQGCGDFPAVHVHHTEYGRGRGKKSLDVPMDKLVSLCQRCHASIHPWMEDQ